ncbi:MAG: NAD-dependent epimerase/dehydratase family protein, partial [bacterium]
MTKLLHYNVGVKILIIGAGYIGLPLACSLKEQGHKVAGWVASETSRARLEEKGLQTICADVADEKAWAQCDKNWDAVVYCISSSRQGLKAFAAVHQRGLELALSHGAPRFLYVSSTSVYGQNDGSEVNENLPTHPTSEKGKILLEAEERVKKCGGVIARLAGIYGPERGFWLQKILSGAPVIEGNGERWLNQIHRDDAA